MTRDKVRVKVCQEDMFDGQTKAFRFIGIDVNVPLGVDDNSLTGLFVTDEIGRVGQTVEVEVL